MWRRALSSHRPCVRGLRLAFSSAPWPMCGGLASSTSPGRRSRAFFLRLSFVLPPGSAFVARCKALCSAQRSASKSGVPAQSPPLGSHGVRFGVGVRRPLLSSSLAPAVEPFGLQRLGSIQELQLRAPVSGPQPQYPSYGAPPSEPELPSLTPELQLWVSFVLGLRVPVSPNHAFA